MTGNITIPKDYLVQYKEKSYSVPYEYRHKKVDINVREGHIHIFYQRREIAKHRIYTAERVVIKTEHLHKDHQLFYEFQPEFIRQWARDLGQNTLRIIEHYLNKSRNYRENVRLLNDFVRMVKNDDLIHLVEEACQQVKAIHSKDLKHVKRALKRLVNSSEEQNTALPMIEHSNIRGATYFSNSGNGEA